MLERLYYDYINNNTDYSDMPKKSEYDRQISDKLVELPSELSTELDTLIGNAGDETEKQGFINGFRYATKIWKEC